MHSGVRGDVGAPTVPKFPRSVTVEAVFSIYSQVAQQRVVANYHRLRAAAAASAKRLGHAMHQQVKQGRRTSHMADFVQPSDNEMQLGTPCFVLRAVGSMANLHRVNAQWRIR